MKEPVELPLSYRFWVSPKRSSAEIFFFSLKDSFDKIGNKFNGDLLIELGNSWIPYSR